MRNSKTNQHFFQNFNEAIDKFTKKLSRNHEELFLVGLSHRNGINMQKIKKIQTICKNKNY